MDLGLKEKVAFVGGSSQGLGRAVAEELAREGARLALCARREATLAEARDAIAGETGVEVIAVAADLATEAGVARAADATLEAFGRVDILVNNTGGPPAASFEELSLEDWRRAERLLLESAVGLTGRFLPGMRERGWGRIVHITSITVKQPVHGLMLSNSLRAAVTGFARTLANEVAADGVTVNCVLPGYTRTRRLEELAEAGDEGGGGGGSAFDRWRAETPMGRLGEPRELAAAVAFLASERASFITAASLAVDGGWIRSLV